MANRPGEAPALRRRDRLDTRAQRDSRNLVAAVRAERARGQAVPVRPPWARLGSSRAALGPPDDRECRRIRAGACEGRGVGQGATQRRVPGRAGRRVGDRAEDARRVDPDRAGRGRRGGRRGRDRGSGPHAAARLPAAGSAVDAARRDGRRRVAGGGAPRGVAGGGARTCGVDRAVGGIAGGCRGSPDAGNSALDTTVRAPGATGPTSATGDGATRDLPETWPRGTTALAGHRRCAADRRDRRAHRARELDRQLVRAVAGPRPSPRRASSQPRLPQEMSRSPRTRHRRSPPRRSNRSQPTSRPRCPSRASLRPRPTRPRPK